MIISVTAMSWLIWVATAMVAAAPLILVIFWWLDKKENRLW